MRRRALKVAQLIVEGLRFRHERSRSHERLPACAGLGEAHRDRDEVLREHHPCDVVWCPVEHGQARVLALPERFEHFLGGCGDIDTGHVEARRHYFVDGRVREREHAEKHIALGGAEVGLQGARRVHHGMQAAVHPGEEPEQRAKRRQCAAREGKSGVRQLGGNARHTARQRVADDEQQECADDQCRERLRPPPRPPCHSVRAGNGTEHEKRKARDVQRAMQRHATFGRDRWCVAQRVQRFADRRFLAQGEQRRPDARADGYDKPDESQRRFREHQPRIRLT